jgi:mersacidin/lichenicidin family type 2 lantibiotic
MSKQSIIRAWKDETYRRGLSEVERAALPESPVGRLNLDELTAAEMAEVQGGNYPVQTRECSIMFQQCNYLK